MWHMRNLVVAASSMIWICTVVPIFVGIGMCLTGLFTGETHTFFDNLYGICKEGRDFICVYYKEFN